MLLGLVVSCTQQTPPPDTQQSKAAPVQPQAQASPAAPATASPAKTERGTPAEAKALLAQAVAHYNEVGRKQALADFNAKKAPFVDRDQVALVDHHVDREVDAVAQLHRV